MASLPGFAARYHCATSTDFSITEHPCDCILTVLSERGSKPYVRAITSEARHGSIWSGVLVAATNKPISDGSPPHSSMHLRMALTPRSVVELVAVIGAPLRNSA